MAATLDAARRRLVDHGLACRSLAVEVGVGLRCAADGTDSPAHSSLLVVDLLADDGGLLTLIQATVDVGGAERPDLAGFLGFYASTVFGIVEDPAPRAVTAWLRAHVVTPGETVVDGLALEMAIERTRSSLRVWRIR
jgi:hypothetical protein